MSRALVAPVYDSRPLQLPVKLLPILKPRRFKILHGGRGGAKSHTIAQVLLMLGTLRSLRVLCVREIQASLTASAMQVLIDYINKHRLHGYYEVLKTEIRSRINDTRFSFAGLQNHNADDIKSWEGADIVWVEEADQVTTDSWNVLIPTIRKAGSEIWASFNPQDEEDYVYDRFVAHVDPDAWVCEVTWLDNPWWSEESENERRKMERNNPDLHAHIYGGKCKTLAGIIFKRVWFKYYEPHEVPKLLTPYGASDWAFTVDGGDWTEHGGGGLDSEGNWYFRNWWSGQTDTATWIDAWCKQVIKDKPRTWFEENGKDRKAMDGAINKAMKEHRPRVYVHRQGLPTVGNKVERAVGFAARCASGAVYLPRPGTEQSVTGTPWVKRLVNQLCAFTGEDGKVDDMVDVCGLIGRGLDSMVDAHKPKADREPAIKPFTEKWFTYKDRKDKPSGRYT